MKIMQVLVLAMVGLRMRRAWLIRRACRPTCESPISPSTSARGTRAATESMTMMSTAFDLTSISAIFSASSALDGWLTSSALEIDADALGPGRVEGMLGVDEGRHAAQLLGIGDGVQGHGRLAADDSVPKISTIRPRGSPLPPRAMSRLSAPVEMPCTSVGGLFAQLHDGALAELLFDGRQRVFQFLVFEFRHGLCPLGWMAIANQNVTILWPVDDRDILSNANNQ